MSAKLLNELNQTVVSSSVQEKDEASLTFFIKYLHSFFNIVQNVSQRDLSKDQKDTMIKLLEEKIAGYGPEAYAQADTLLPISRILIRHSKSNVLRDYLAGGVKRFARRLNFEELHSTLYSLKQSYKAAGEAGQT